MALPSPERLDYELEEATEKLCLDSVRRNKPMPVNKAHDKNLVHLLASMVTSWPMTDLRLETAYQLDHDVESTDCDYMREVSRGMDVRIARKDIPNGMLWVDVLFQTNMAEYERYNIVVNKHNDDWLEMDCPVDTFDPKHGDILPIQDTYVAPAHVKSPFIHDIPSLSEDSSSGPLAHARPTTKHSVGVTVQYRISLQEQMYHLEYVARDTAGHVLYYNRTRAADLTYLVRRSIQELWGNPSIYGNKGAYLEGISMLYQGRKMALCRKENAKPSILSGYAKDVSVQLVASKTARGSMKVLTSVFAYVIPTILAVAAILWVFMCISGSRQEGVTGMDVWFVGGEVIILTIGYASVKIAHYLTHMEHAQSMRERFL